MERLTRSASLDPGNPLTFLALGEVVVISRFVQRDRIEAARRIDRVARWIYLAAVIVVVAAFFLV